MTEPPLSLSRRGVLLGAAAGLATIPFGAAGLAAPTPPAAAAALKPLRFAWNANAACLAPVALAKSAGLFSKYGLDVELVNYSGSTDQLLESLATGKADAAVGMALRWIKPLEQGFDVKLIGGTHGGCLRMLGVQGTGVTADIASLKGKTVGTPDLGGPDKNFFSLLAQKRGLDPVKDISWRQYPADLLPVAAEKGEIQAFSHSDPLTWLFLKRHSFLFEVATNLTGEYLNRLCCLIGVRGSLLRQDRAAAESVYRALLDAQTLTHAEPRLTAEAFQPYSPKASVEDLIAMLKSHTHGHSPVGTAFRQEIVTYAEELKQINVLKPTTDPQKYADRVYVNVLAG